MKSTNSALGQKKLKILKNGLQPKKLPFPASVRHRQKIEHWGDMIWQSRNKYFVVLQPQMRELVRKLRWTMEQANRTDMIDRLNICLMELYFKTGSTQKMEGFIEDVTNGHVFLYDSKHQNLPKVIPADFPELASLTNLLIYVPRKASKWSDTERVIGARRFVDFLGPIPINKPWISEWLAEIEDVRKRAVKELGKELVNQQWPKAESATSGKAGVLR